MKKFTLLAILALTLLPLSLHARPAADNNNKFTPEMKLRFAERIISNFYVDELDSARVNHIIEDGIIAMLKKLDPHSLYSNPEETTELTTPLEGNFSGIGIQFNMLNDTLFVIQTIPGGPSEKVGIIPGDRILQAGDSILSGRHLPNSAILRTLRGPKGTPVSLKVLRRGSPQPIQFNLVRDDIPVYSVDAAFMADPTTGYVRITRFAETTDRELQEALTRLSSQGMKNLIIDLSDNGGGYLGAATSIASRFLPKGAPIVYTESTRGGTTPFNADNKDPLLKNRLAIIVNQHSASASEILAGAIQDNDRGVIVGRRTFGKGLVQRPFPLPDGSMIRLTVSRYHTPSGRCIQRPYDSEHPDDYSLDLLNRLRSGEFMSADSIHFTDSLRYETINRHRTVYGGGGIMPDHFVPVDTTYYTTYYRDLVAKGTLNRFAITYVDNHRSELHATYPTEDQFITQFQTTPAIIDALVAMGQADGVAPDPQKLAISLPAINIILKGMIGRDLFDTTTYYKIVYPAINPEYRAALQLINDPKEYNRLLK